MAARVTAVRRLFSLTPKLPSQTACFSTSYSWKEDDGRKRAKATARELNQKGLDEQEKLQSRAPWMREGSDDKPADSLGKRALTKGKLLTTPSRLLKLILPLNQLQNNNAEDGVKDIEPLALLVHPQQPLSYLERLIQSEIPMIEGKDGKEKIPEVHFRAEDAADTSETGALEEGSDVQIVDGKRVKLGKIEKEERKGAESVEMDEKAKARRELRGGHGEGGAEWYSGKGREGTEASKETKFVRWSSSTEIGDFIRDAARGKEFAVQIEGAAREIRVGVPSFNDRTHYLRSRLQKTSSKLEDLAAIKSHCDHLAHRGAKRLAMGGFGVLASWWGSIYYFTFMTPYGWDTMEPITYLGGLSTIMLGYLWFLYHNREVSYKSALNLTVSKRQDKLYQDNNFDVVKWESLIEEANALRKEIKVIAAEYDVEWDEKMDDVSETVHKALKKERKREQREGEKDDEDDEEEDVKEDEKEKKGD